ncbi:MAG: primosomal protein N' [Ignavibacteriales bacterium]|nr:primosomal protein N' [Ignavibacteriales bacterium]
MKELFADIAIPVAVDKLFTYRVPPELQSAAQRGVRVAISLGKRSVVGLITNIKETTEIKNLKSIREIIDVKPILPEDLFQTTRWMSDYYFSPLGEVLKSAYVFSTLKSPQIIISQSEKTIDTDLFGKEIPREFHTIFSVIPAEGGISLSQLKRKLRIKNLSVVLKKLSERGLITVEEAELREMVKPKSETVIEIQPESFNVWEAWLKEFYSQSSKQRQKQITIIQSLLHLDEKTDCISLNELLKNTGASISSVTSLRKKNIIKLGRREVFRTPQFEMYRSALGATDIILNSYQQNALNSFNEAVDRGKYSTFLLHGITGSGKTQVYIETIKHVIKAGKSAIVLVPEISLTPQIVRRFKYNLGENVVVMHSRMSGGERFDAWRMAWGGKNSVVIGPRSAIFAPLHNLGLIVVDEEHEASYKQFDQTPRYHARDVAIMRASFSGSVVILGSATPSLESYTNALNGKYKLIELPERVDNAQLPGIKIIDIGKERSEKLDKYRLTRKQKFKEDPAAVKLLRPKYEFSSLSDSLKNKIQDRLNKKEGIILLQNRRGFAPFIECPECGYVEMCNNCNITLTYHESKKHLRCHYCGFVKQSPIFCPKCDSIDIQYRGFGTQRVEVELKKIFPKASIIRMDLDTTSSRGSHDKLLKQFGEGKADILLGTQMVAKGLDFSRVTLVGVISADTQMLLPDFRSSERTFQLLTQVAGRAGRSNLAGEVIIQTLQPKHPSLQFVAIHDFKGFYSDEITYRSQLQYPPYSRIILIEFRGKKESEVIEYANSFASIIKKNNQHFITMGPAAAALAKLQGEYRWHVVIKSLRNTDPAGRFVHHAISKTVQHLRESLRKNKAVKMTVDVDPVGMM